MTREVAAGMSFAINATLLTSKNMTAITGATEAVATLEASAGFAVGELGVILSSGWGKLVNRIFRIKAVATNDYTLEKLDTTNTNFFGNPPATGAGKVAEIDINGWKELTELDADALDVSGGDRATQTLTPVSLGGDQVAYPTTRAPYVWKLGFFEDASAEGWYATAKTASENGTPVALRCLYPSGLKIYAWCKVALKDAPVQQGFNVPKGEIVLMAQGAVVRFNP